MSAAMSLTDELEQRSVDVTTLFRLVDFVCPVCGDERRGAHVDSDDGTTSVECFDCGTEFGVAVLAVPTRAGLAAWRDDAVLRGDTALRCADDDHPCSMLALASCRRLAPELTDAGKGRLLAEMARTAGGVTTRAQRAVLLELGVALGLSAPAINGLLAVL